MQFLCHRKIGKWKDFFYWIQIHKSSKPAVGKDGTFPVIDKGKLQSPTDLIILYEPKVDRARHSGCYKRCIPFLGVYDAGMHVLEGVILTEAKNPFLSQ